MNNYEIGKIFHEIGELLEISGGNIFKIRAYLKAAEVLTTYPDDLEKIYRTSGVDGLKDINGVGESIALKIEEYIKTGKIQFYEDLKKKLPEGLLDILSVSGVGPKKAKYFYEKLNIKNIDELEIAAKEHKLKDLPGMGEKSEEKIIKGIEFRKKVKDRFLLGVALPYVETIISYLKQMKEIDKISVGGSVRRGKETVRDIDILITTDKPEKIIQHFLKMENISSITAKGDTKASVLTKDDIQVDLRVIEPNSFGAALNYFTGSKEHNIRLREMAIKKGLKLSEYGIFKENKMVSGKTEEEIYKTLDMIYIEPELRENRGEIEDALKGKLPDLIELKEIKGDLHIHTKASDGVEDLEDIIKASKQKGYKYIGITDHSQSLKVAGGLSEKELKINIKKIKDMNSKLNDFRILIGTEVDIKSDGTLDYEDSILNELDYSVGAIHSGFNMNKNDMTRRIITAIKSKKINILAHPSGRILGEREAFDVDMGEIIKAAKDYNVVMELNASPFRLDLTDINCKLAKENGVQISINTDMHTIGELDNMKYGVITARRGWLEKKDIINCMDLNELIKIFKRV